MPADGRPFSLSLASDLDETGKDAGLVVAVNDDADGYELVEQGGGPGGGADLSDTDPEALGASADAGVSTEASRSDHVHELPSAADVGAAAVSHVHSGADITSGTVADARIASTIARDSEVTAAIAALATVYAAIVHVHSGADITSGTVAEARIDAAIARDAEVTAAVAAEASARDAAITAAIDALIDSSPGTLDTLNELAAALGDDPDFAASVTTALAGKQPLDDKLTAFAGLVSAADRLGYFTGSGTMALATFTTFARSMLDDADAATVLGTLGVSAFVQSLLDDADAGTARATLGVIASLFQNGGAQEISVAGLSGELADPQPTDAAHVDSGAATDGQILTADGAGGAAWEDAPAGGAVAASDVSIVDAAGDFTATDVEGALAELQSDAETDAQNLADHLADSSGAHAASAVSVDSTGLVGTGTDAQTVLGELDDAIANHLADSSDAHDASAVSVLDTAGNFTGTDVEAVLAELQDNIDSKTTAAAALSAAQTEIADQKRVVEILVSDPGGSAITTGDGKAYFRVPSLLNGHNLVAVAASVSTTSSSGIPTVQIRNATQTADMLSTKLTIDEGELDSKDATAAAVIDTSNDDVATGDQIFVDVDVAGTGTKGLLVSMTFEAP